MSSSTVEAGPVPGLASGTWPSFTKNLWCRFGIIAGCRPGKLGVKAVFQINWHPLVEKVLNRPQIRTFLRAAE